MSAVLPYAVLFGSLAVVLAGCAWCAVLARRRGATGAARAALAAYEEAFHGTARVAHVEIQAQSRRKVPMPSPGDPRRPTAAPAEGRAVGRP